ncbi:MAG: hypothetical protein ACOYT4_02125 [Nanoarchaeota archaeon]
MESNIEIQIEKLNEKIVHLAGLEASEKIEIDMHNAILEIQGLHQKYSSDQRLYEQIGRLKNSARGLLRLNYRDYISLDLVCINNEQI